MDVTGSKLQHQSSTSKKVELQYLRTITKQFSKDQILGNGGFGTVYKGVKEDGEVVAVKKLMNMVGMDDKQFLNEVKHLMDLCHPNIVRLEGYCYHIERELTSYNGSYIFVDEVYRLLCFEYLPNGSLDKHLTDESSGLDWHTRYNIIEGICKGLHYLHEGRRGAPILHLDLKPSNILLDKNMVPKIADFGLSRLFGDEKTHTCTMKLIGSFGYMPPEYIEKRMISKESDIFSLGVIIIEIVTGYRKYPDGTTTQEFIEVPEKWRRRLQTTSNYTSLEEECRQVKQCIEVGLKCMERDPKKRPNIRGIIEMLDESENMNSCSVRKDGFDVAKQSGEMVSRSMAGSMISRENFGYADAHMDRHMVPRQMATATTGPADWREALDIVALGLPEQSVEGMKVICHELTQAVDHESPVLDDLIREADRLVSCLSVTVPKTFNFSLSGASSTSCKYVLNTLMQTFQIKRLAHAVKEGTLDNLFTELLLWLLDDRVPLMDDGSQLLKALNVLMLKILDNAERTSSFVVLINLLRPLDPSRWLSCTPSESLAVKNEKFSDLVVKCLIKLTKVLQSTIYEVDLDRILQSIHIYLQELGMEEIRRRAGANDKPLRMVKTVLHELVKLRGTAIKGHLSMVPIDAEPQPIILAYIDLNLQNLAAARMLPPSRPMDQTQWGDAASNSPNSSTHSANTQLKVQCHVGYHI